MNKYQQQIINEYENYLNDEKEEYIKIDNLKAYEKEVQLEFKKLKRLDEKHKLYDKNYESFRLSMARLALGINKLEESNSEKVKFAKIFIKLNDEFEELMQRNIMKDAYVWNN